MQRSSELGFRLDRVLFTVASVAIVGVTTGLPVGCASPAATSNPDPTSVSSLDPDAAHGGSTLAGSIPDASDFDLASSAIFLKPIDAVPSETPSTAGGVDPVAASGDAATATVVDPEGVTVSLPAGPEGGSTDLPMSLQAISEQLHRLAATADDPLPLELVAAVMLLAAEDPAALDDLPIAAEARSQLMADEIETREAFAAFARAVRARLDDGESWRSVLVPELAELANRLRNEPDLRIGDADICSAIRAYGDVDRLPHRLSARVDREVLVYVPLEGLDWIEDSAGGRFRWQLRHRLELHQLSDGLVIDPGSWTMLDHALPEPTRDTFLWVRYTIPGRDLASGRYALKVRIEEPSTGRQAERTIDLDLLPERLVARE